MKEISPQLKNLIKSKSKAVFANCEIMELNKFNQLVLLKNGIQYKEYVEPGSKLKNFFDLLSDILYTRKVKEGLSDVWYCSRIDSDFTRIEILLSQLIAENDGYYYLCYIPKRINDDLGIDYKKRSAGKKLRLWLEDSYSHVFKVSEDGNILLPVNSEQEPEFEPKNPEAVSLLVAQMHAISGMGYWSSNAKKLQQYTQLTKTSEEWSRAVAKGFADALLGMNCLYLYKVEENSRLVFDTGLKTTEGNILFCVLAEKELTEGSSQPFRLEGFCSLFDEDSELVREIKKYVPQIIKTTADVNSKYEELNNALEQLMKIKDALIDADVDGILKNGSMLEFKTFNLINRYYMHWEEINEILAFLGWSREEGSEEVVDVEFISKRLEYSNKKNDLFFKAIEAVCNALERIVEYASNLHFPQAFIDFVKKDIENFSSAKEDALPEIEDAIKHYLLLSGLVDEKELSDSVIEAMDLNGQYFTGLNSVIQATFLVGKRDEPLLKGNVEALNDAITLLSMIDETHELDVQREDASEIDADNLFADALNSADKSYFVSLSVLIPDFCKTRFEKLLARGEYEKAKDLLEQGNADIPPSSTKEEIEARLTEREALEKLSEEDSLSLHECAKRLYAIIGNYNRTAEKFFIAALAFDSKSGGEALLELYTSEHNSEKMFVVWSRYCDDARISAEQFSLLLEYLAKNRPEEIEGLLAKNPAYYYIDSYAREIVEELADIGIDGMSERAEKYSGYIKNLPPFNEFEEVIRGCNGESAFVGGIIKNYIDDNEELMSQFYSEEEMGDITKTVESLEFAQATVSPVEMLYNMQKNKNGAAERVALESLAEGFDESACLVLLRIFKEESRAEELCFFFEAYKKQLESSRTARELYFWALVYVREQKLFGFVADNFQDVISVIKESSPYYEEMEALFEAVADEDDGKLNELINKLREIRGLFNEPILSSIALLSNDLRAIASDTENLFSFGLYQNQIDLFLSSYKTDSYSHGRSLMAVAERIYSFIGVCGNIVSTLLDLARYLGRENVELEWKVYTSLGDAQKQFELLENNPELVEGKQAEYCSVLFSLNMYKEFLEKCEEFGFEGGVFETRRFIAGCNLKRDISGFIEKMISSEHISPRNMREISSVLVEFGYNSEYEALIIEKMDYMLSDFSGEEIEEVFSAQGKTTEDMLKKLQKRAVAEGAEGVATYIFEVFGLGRYKTASKAYFNKMLPSCAQYSEPEERKLCYKQLLNIYYKNNELATSIILEEINAILNCVDGPEDKQKEIVYILENASLTDEGLKRIMEISVENEFLMTQQICLSVLRAGIERELQYECVEYLNGVAILDSFTNFDLLSKSCLLFNYMFETGQFKTEWHKNAESICLKLLGTNYFGKALYCLYRSYNSVGETDIAKYALLLLMENKNKFAAELSEIIEAEAEKVFTQTADVFDLFMDAAERYDINQLTEYCRKCGKLIIMDKTKYYEYRSDGIQKTLSRADINFLITALFLRPDDTSLWEDCLMMPVESKPVVYIKVLYKLSQGKPALKNWVDCIEACERYAQSDLMAEVLMSCAKVIQFPFGLRDLREFLLERVKNNPTYFALLSEQDAIELMAQLSEITKADRASENYHNAIRDMTTLSLATESEAVLENMLNFFAGDLYGANSNVGLATACRLILKKDFVHAAEMLSNLSENGRNIKYAKLIDKLSKMSLQELAEWSSVNINKRLLDIIIPDGNWPRIEEINDFVLEYSATGKAEEATRLICEILENNPKDYGCYMALFMLCKQLPERVDLLHMALCGLVQNNPMPGFYYDRERKDYAVFLAKINAVILARRLNVNPNYSFGDYDFRITAKDYYIKHESDARKVNNVEYLEAIADAQKEAQALLTNQSDEGLKIVSDIILSSITGNWTGLIIYCWQNKINLNSYLHRYYEKINSNDGLARSIIKAFYSVLPVERLLFKEWTKSQFTEHKEQYEIATYIINNNKRCLAAVDSGVFEGDIFSLPYEENCISSQIFNKTVMEFVDKAPDKVSSCAIIVGALAKKDGFMSLFWKTATEVFYQQNEDSQPNDLAACGLFEALLVLYKEFNIFFREEKDSRKTQEVYESLMRVAGVFSGNEAIINKVSGQNFNAHSCVNMVLALTYTPRANEVNRLKKYFSEENQILTDAIVCACNPDVEDEVKISKAKEIPSDYARCLMYFLLRQNKDGVYGFLNSNKFAGEITKEYINIARKYTKLFSNKDIPTPKKYIWIEPARINKDNIVKQLEIDDTEIFETVVSVGQQDDFIQEAVELSFVKGLEPVENADESIEELWARHESISSFGFEGYEPKLEISGMIYRIALGKDSSKLALNDYALRYGVDYYCSCIGSNNYEQANKILFEMVNIYEYNRESEGASLLKRIVCGMALYELLFRGFSNIYDLVKSYFENKASYIRMRNMLPSSMRQEIGTVNSIYNALESLENLKRDARQDMLPVMRDMLFKALRVLGSVSVIGWGNVKGQVQRMLQNEINRIDQRPRLFVEVLSEKAYLPYGSIFGQVKNVGNDIAENIVIQIHYPDNDLSEEYVLPSLEKEASAPFEIPYSAPDGVEEIIYDIAVSFSHCGETESYTISAKKLIITSDKFENFDSGIYLTDRPIGDFIALEDGTVHSDNFFGREEEIRSINNIFKAKSFAEYKNVIIKGIRRAGKTSVLNYMREYIKSNCDDAIAVYTDCSGVGDDKTPIYTTLVKPAIRESKRMNNTLSIGEQEFFEKKWEVFDRKWAMKDGGEDFGAEDLQDFYRDLKDINNGKGIMLIIDEFDILLEALETRNGVDSNLLPSLRGLLNNADCQSAIHLVICGSNKMIRYMDGGTFNQLFQQFGSNDITIGMLLNREMEAMLKTVLEARYPYVSFSQEALASIWDYTNGLVWYSKLIATYSLERARKNTRTVVYPSDVVHAVKKVVGNDDFFKSLVTSCTPNELKVLDALQGITSRATEYVSVPKLLEALAEEFTQKDIEGIINTLERMQFVEKNPYESTSYRFAVQLYWSYFRKKPSNFDRVAEIPIEFLEKRI